MVKQVRNIRPNGQETDISDLFNHFLLHFRRLEQRRIQFRRDLVGRRRVCNFRRC